MSRDPRYQRLLNSKQWRELRRWYMQQHPLCERCIEEGEAAGIPGGYIRSAVDCHHIIPIERAKTEQEMERLAFDPNNLRALCIPCHIKTHKEMNTHKKSEVQANRERAFERWKQRMSGSQGKPTDPPTATPEADAAAVVGCGKPETSETADPSTDPPPPQPTPGP